MKQEGLSLLVVDDFGHAEHYWADVVLNQDMNAEECLYRSREPYTRLLLGPEYVCLRREFRRLPRVLRRSNGAACKLLVTLGGSDPGNVSELVIQSFGRGRADDLEAIVLVGPGNPHAARLATAASKCRAKVRLIENPPDIPGLMGWCDVAVTAGGGTLWELGYFGIPCLVLVVAPNQEPCARLLHNQQACRVLGEADALDSASLAEEISTFLHDAALRLRSARGLLRWSMVVVDSGFAMPCASIRRSLRRDRFRRDFTRIAEDHHDRVAAPTGFPD